MYGSSFGFAFPGFGNAAPYNPGQYGPSYQDNNPRQPGQQPASQMPNYAASRRAGLASQIQQGGMGGMPMSSGLDPYSIVNTFTNGQGGYPSYGQGGIPSYGQGGMPNFGQGGMPSFGQGGHPWGQSAPTPPPPTQPAPGSNAGFGGAPPPAQNVNDQPGYVDPVFGDDVAGISYGTNPINGGTTNYYQDSNGQWYAWVNVGGNWMWAPASAPGG